MEEKKKGVDLGLRKFIKELGYMTGGAAPAEDEGDVPAETYDDADEPNDEAEVYDGNEA